MTEQTEIEKLDMVLNALVKDYEYQQSVPGVIESLTIKLDSPETHQILDKLVKDGYADKINVELKTPVPVKDKPGFFKSSEFLYIVTFEGKFFKKQGGYAQREINENIKIAEIKDRNKRMERNEELLVTQTQNVADRTKELTYWTKWVGIGAVGLVLVELLNIGLEHHWFRWFFSCG